MIPPSKQRSGRRLLNRRIDAVSTRTRALHTQVNRGSVGQPPPIGQGGCRQGGWWLVHIQVGKTYQIPTSAQLQLCRVRDTSRVEKGCTKQPYESRNGVGMAINTMDLETRIPRDKNSNNKYNPNRIIFYFHVLQRGNQSVNPAPFVSIKPHECVSL